MHNDDIDGDANIDLRYYWEVIRSRWVIIGCFVFLVTSVTIVASLLMPKMYTAKAVIMPISGAPGGGGLAALAAQVGGLGSLIGLGGGGGSAQQFMAFLTTRILAEQVIVDNNLLPVFFPNEADRPVTMNERAVKSLVGHMNFSENIKAGTITVSAEFEDPKIAANIANAYVSGLQEFINGNALTISKRNRIFLGKQLEENKRNLLEAGKELSAFYRGNKISSIESYIDVPIVKTGKSKARSLHSELDFGKEGDTDEKNRVELDRLQKQKMELKSALQRSSSAQLTKQQDENSNMLDPVDLTKEDPSVDDENWVKNVPQQTYLQYLTLHRGLLVQVNTLLMQQYEMAKVNEMKDEFAFQVIDPARVPEKRSSPRRTRMVMLAFLGSLFVSVAATCLLDKMEKLSRV